MNSETRICQNCKKDFTIEPEDFSFYEKLKVPAPTFCPDCRLQRRLAWINERSLYFRNCSLCNKRIMSMYAKNSPYEVYCSSCYHGDKWEGTEYGISFNFNKTFFEQFNELQAITPKVNLEQSQNYKVESEYANHVFSRSKNIYLSFIIVRCEDCMYSKMGANGNKGCLDCFNFNGNERCYELSFSGENYESVFLIDSHSCVHSLFLYDCKNCTNCFMSTHLRNKSYIFRNKQLSREDYLREISKIKTENWSVFENLKKEFKEISLNTFKRYATIVNSLNSTGDLIFDSKNIKNSFSVVDSENVKYTIFNAGGAIDVYDMIYSGKNEQGYELLVSGARNFNASFSFQVTKSKDVFYSFWCNNCSNIFGCIGLKNKQYCILNKQYTKEEYERLLQKIIENMNTQPYVDKKGRVYKYGEFFPIELSSFAYNESLAYEEFPMKKQEAIEQGYIWRDNEEKYYKASIESRELTDSLNDISDNILSETIACPNKGQIETKCTFAYKIMPEELLFYRLMHIPLPHYCPNCRYYERRKWKNSWKLWHRTCMCDKENHQHQGKCEVEFETSYAPDRSEIIYCERCYQQEVY